MNVTDSCTMGFGPFCDPFPTLLQVETIHTVSSFVVLVLCLHSVTTLVILLDLSELWSDGICPKRERGEKRKKKKRVTAKDE